MPEVGYAVDLLASFGGCLILDEHCKVDGFVGDALECSDVVIGRNGFVGAVASEELSVGVGRVWESSGIEA